MPFLARDFGIVHVFVGMSISAQVICATSSRRWPVRMRSRTIGPNGYPSPSQAFQTCFSSVSLNIRSRFRSGAGALIFSQGDAATIPRSVAQLNSLRKAAKTRLAIIGVPRSTVASEGHERLRVRCL